MPAPWITDVKQVCVLTEDLDKTIKAYWQTAGIGPWAVWTPELTGMRIRGKEQNYSMKLALAWTNGFMWEVVQPLEGPTIYREFLDQHGEGLHHVLVQTSENDFGELMENAKKRGMPPLMEGKWGATQFAYIDSEGPLKMVLQMVEKFTDKKGDK